MRPNIGYLIVQVDEEVKKIAEDRTLPSGIVIPASIVEYESESRPVAKTGRVLEANAASWKDGVSIPQPVKRGNRVWFKSHCGIRIGSGKQVLVLAEEEVIAYESDQ